MTIIQPYMVRPSSPDVKPFSERSTERSNYLGISISIPRITPKPRKLRVLGNEVSVRMEQELWEDFERISATIKASPSHLARRILVRAAGVYGPTFALREFILRYWRSAAEMPNMNADARIRAVLWHLGNPPQNHFDGLVLRMQDALAPVLTDGRVKMIATVSRVDLCDFAARVREAWGSTAPWAASEDYVAGCALEALIPHQATGTRVN
ncbi:hypothetical protein [Azospirillum canadense]|uniref:hypothetical protein n=1 Tax=Azospirillum canadense TaxID=403962 RepID=UPI0022274B6D|nr:hypothetical protein [Azospirillum canadense]MCW2239260.1 putative DNA-binding ribbon-helix-helix protein [Azospirillum canadense]